MIQRLTTTLTITVAASSMFLCGCKAERHEVAAEGRNGMATTAPGAMEMPSDAASAPTGNDDRRPVIACFGDSLTAGYGVDEDNTYPADLQRELDKAGYRYRVVNMGISGDTTKDGLSRVDRVLALRPALTIVEFGGNDGLRGVPIPSSRQNLDDLLGRLAQSGTQIAIAGITLPPQYSAPYIQQFNQTYTILAKKYSAPLLPFVLKDVYGVPGSIQPDGVHPTSQGCRQVAKNILHLIQPMLRK